MKLIAIESNYAWKWILVAGRWMPVYWRLHGFGTDGKGSRLTRWLWNWLDRRYYEYRLYSTICGWLAYKIEGAVDDD